MKGRRMGSDLHMDLVAPLLQVVCSPWKRQLTLARPLREPVPALVLVMLQPSSYLMNQSATEICISSKSLRYGISRTASKRPFQQLVGGLSRC